ncbi:MAG: M20/M25/M40 family metallo-hydrolase [candidate division KSB1 bacterium]|nr:M20/M25/M40 family metallo-hydrolase [candidate division KSB1 bacterium]
MKRTRGAWLWGVACWLWLVAVCASFGASPDCGGLEAISGGELMAIVQELCRPELDGRLPGSKGYDVAARYAADWFQHWGLRPAGDEGFFQYLEVEYNEFLSPPRLALMGKGGELLHECELGKDFVARGFSGSGKVTGQVVFCGYGLSSPEHGYDDYAGVDVRGKVVLAFKQAPTWQPEGADWGERAMPRPKAEEARKRGARALLLVSCPNVEPVQRPIGSVMHGPGRQQNIPQLHIDVTVADRLLAEAGVSLRELQARIDSTHRPHSFVLPSQVRVEVKARYHKTRRTMNVVAFLPGADPALSKECVVVGAHLDHVGRQSPTVYYPGANDNASGSAAVMAMAKAFAQAATRPRRSVVFVLFASEEQGMLGAEAYANRPPFPLSKTVAMLNLDCIGIGDSIGVYGGKDFPELFALVQEHDRLHTRLLSAASGGGGGADAGPFHRRGVPNLYFATTNGYAHLHLPSDTPDTLEPELFTAATRLAYLTAWALADRSPTGINQEILHP